MYQCKEVGCGFVTGVGNDFCSGINNYRHLSEIRGLGYTHPIFKDIPIHNDQILQVGIADANLPVKYKVIIELIHRY